MSPPRLRTKLYQWATQSWPRYPLGLVHDAVIAAELTVERVFDRSVPPDNTPTLDHLTALIKTFERPRVLRRLVASIQRCYPTLKIIVVDDSRTPGQLPGLQTIPMPFNSGLSQGRNEGLKHIPTPYTLLLDDDFICYRHTALTPALALMETHPEIDIQGGAVINLPFYTGFDYAHAALYPTQAAPKHPAGSRIGGLTVLDKVANFFIARTEALRLLQWDPALRLVEHADFFTRAKGKLTTVFNPALKILHAPTPFDKPYMDYRNDYLLDIALIQRKYFLPDHSHNQ